MARREPDRDRSDRGDQHRAEPPELHHRLDDEPEPSGKLVDRVEHVSLRVRDAVGASHHHPRREQEQRGHGGHGQIAATPMVAGRGIAGRRSVFAHTRCIPTSRA
jgi:hypothetical protein